MDENVHSAAFNSTVLRFLEMYFGDDSQRFHWTAVLEFYSGLPIITLSNWHGIHLPVASQAWVTYLEIFLGNCLGTWGVIFPDGENFSAGLITSFIWWFQCIFVDWLFTVMCTNFIWVTQEGDRRVPQREMTWSKSNYSFFPSQHMKSCL